MKFTENIDITNPKTLIIFIIVLLIIFTIIYIYIHRPVSNSVEPFAQYDVGVGDLVSLAGLDNVIVGTNNPITLTDSITQLLTNSTPILLSGYAKNTDLTPITGNISQIQNSIRDLVNSDTIFNNRIQKLDTNLNTELNQRIGTLETLVNNNMRTLTASVNSATPEYTIVAFHGTTAPPGWQLCDGALLKYNDNQTPLYPPKNTPDLRGRTVVGVNTGSSKNNDNNLLDLTLNSSGGSSTHTLTISEMPDHTHNMPICCSPNNSGVNGARLSSGIENTNNSGYWPIQQTGGGRPHNNMQPYYTLNYIIKQPIL
jgi:microcystin-dependent protein